MPGTVSTATQQARRLVEHRDGHPIISLYLDLDPERFATAPARASQIRSLIDQASKEVEADETVSHDDRQALREDLRRVEEFLESADAPYEGARALAVFCSTPGGLFECVPLNRPVPGRVVIGRRPHVEPLLSGLEERRWLVALVNRGSAWLWSGSPAGLRQRERVADDVHGQHDQGGWSQARYERSVEKDVDDHLRGFAEDVTRRWRQERFDRLAVGGPQETVPRFVEMLGQELRDHLAPDRLEIDLSEVSEAHVREAIEKLAEEDERRTERGLLDRLNETPGRSAVGIEDTITALNERRVGQLLIDPQLDGQAYRCPRCGLLARAGGECPGDGADLEQQEDLREALAEAAIAQDADLVVLRHQEDLGRLRGVGALLRF